MSLKWTEYDPYTGVTEVNTAYDDDDYVHVQYFQDAQPLLDLAAEARNTKSADGRRELYKYASVNVVMQYELLKKGINIFNPDHMPRVLEEINANYPKAKYTDKIHSLTPKRNVTQLSVPQDSQKPEISEAPGTSLIVP
jgi:hypothetical protein